MTERRQARGHTAMWALAPVTAGVFGVATTWAIQHNPIAETAASPPISSPAAAAPASASEPPRLRALEARLDAATAQYNATRRSLLGVERTIRRGEVRLAALRGGSGSGSTSSPVSSGPGGSQTAPPPAAPPAAAPPPAAPAPPAPPPVSTTTGAS